MGGYSSLINVYTTYSAKTTCIIKAFRERVWLSGVTRNLHYTIHWETTTSRSSSGGIDKFHAFRLALLQLPCEKRQLRCCVEFHYLKDRANCWWESVLGESGTIERGFRSVDASNSRHCVGDRLLPVLALWGKVGLKGWTIPKRHLPAP